ncbi:MAG TPA: hypothetical protein VMY05_12200 [Acidobacteriota bacterium]|nr:hypothetical protein [Acidobacteriota bacterium]
MTVNRRRIVLAVLAVALTAAAVTINVTDVCHLEAVTLNGEPVENWQDEYGLSEDRMILRQPVDKLVTALLDQEGVFKVDVDYQLMHAIDVRTNNFTPACFVVDEKSGRLKGLNATARVVLLGPSVADWEHPVLTNVTADRLYDYCDDPRVRIIVPQLIELRGDNVDLYRLISEVDFGRTDCLIVTVAGLPYRLKVDAAQFESQINEYVTFLEQFDADLKAADALDLRLDNMIIKEGGAQ